MLKKQLYLALIFILPAHAMCAFSWSSFVSFIKKPFTSGRSLFHVSKTIQNQSTFTQWYKACKELPMYRHVGQNFSRTALTLEELDKTIDTFNTVMKESSLRKASCWLDQAPDLADEFFTSLKPLEPIRPFVQKIKVNAETVMAFRGDLHGDIHSLIEYIKFLQDGKYLDDNFTIQDKDKFFMVFLGDYVDRGNYGTEVLYTLMRLKIANPENVLMVRGNHEDIRVTARFGFKSEFFEKFRSSNSLQVTESYEKLSRLYDFLPVALYVGCGAKDLTYFIQCCHGGMEIGFNPQTLLDYPQKVSYQWLGMLDQPDALEIAQDDYFSPFVKAKLKKFEPSSFYSIGFMWNDFIVSPHIKQVDYKSSRGFMYGKAITDQVLKASSSAHSKLMGVFRAHQHTHAWSDMMVSILHKDGMDLENLGLSKLWNDKETQPTALWQSIVCTFLVGPDSVYGQPTYDFDGFNFDAFALLTLQKQYEDWTLKVYRNTIIQ